MTVTMRGSTCEIIVTLDIDYLKYLKASLGKREWRQFETAIARPMTRLETELTRHLISDDLYYPLSECKNRPGRNHLATRKVADGSKEVSENCFFANALTMVEADYDRHGNPSYMPPKDRARLGPLQIYTFEFDYPDMDFFRRQLGWLRSNEKKATDSVMGSFYKACRVWADFRGITVNWSGNKSLHIHVAFDTATYVAKCGDPEAGLRSGLIAHWRDLEQMLLRHLGLSGTDYHSDQQLSFPEQYRRLPNSWRLIEGDHHLLGIPHGTLAKQVTLWEQWCSRAPSGATALFHRPTFFNASGAPQRGPKSQGGWQGDTEFSTEEISYCEDRLREFFPDHTWPRLAHIRKASGCWAAMFYNSAQDQNPSSVMREGYRVIMLQGRDHEDLVAQSLPAALGEMMARWVDEMHAPQNEVVEIDGPDILLSSGFEREFAGASTLKEAADVVDRHLPLAILRHPFLLVNGPEGVGKTSALLRHHATIAQRLEPDAISDRANPRRALYAFISYEAAKEKCAAFNALHQSSRYVGVLLRSFTAAYQQACERLHLLPISKAQAAQDGYASHWRAIEERQPAVIDDFRRRHAELWDMIGDRDPVFFSVHQVAHGWHLSNPTRLMWAPSFWEAPPGEQNRICREETRLSLLVHDEVKPDTFARLLPLASHEWLSRLRQRNPQAWTGGTLADQARALAHHQQHDPAPQQFKSEELPMLMALDFDDHVMTADSGEYGPCDNEFDIYGACHGREWRVARRRWWQDADATRVAFLTTESLPTAAAMQADPDISIANLHLVGVDRDAIMVYPRKGIVADKLETAITDWRSQRGEDWFAVSNRVAGCPDTTTHAAARGSNALIGRRIVQTMTFLPTTEYEHLQALNSWCGRADLVRLRHFDEFNQTAGRNRGFRNSEGSEHALLIGHRLLDLLQPFAGLSRYDWTIQLTAAQRRTIKRKRRLVAAATANVIAPAFPVAAAMSGAANDDQTLLMPRSTFLKAG